MVVGGAACFAGGLEPPGAHFSGWLHDFYCCTCACSCLLVHVDCPDIRRLDMSMSGYVCGYVRTCPDLSIETAWICPDMLVLTPICLCQHLSLTQDFCVNVKTQSLLPPSSSHRPALYCPPLSR